MNLHGPRSRTLVLAVALATAATASGCVSRKTVGPASSGALTIKSVEAEPGVIRADEQAVLTATVDNPSGTPLFFVWNAYQGSVIGNGSSARYYGSYCCAGTDWVLVRVEGENGEFDTELKVLTVTPAAP
jgi:hypothetical protein